MFTVRRFYLQGGERIDLPSLYVVPPTDGSHMRPLDQPSLTSSYCTDIYDRWNGNAAYEPLAQVSHRHTSPHIRHIHTQAHIHKRAHTSEHAAAHTQTDTQTQARGREGARGRGSEE